MVDLGDFAPSPAPPSPPPAPRFRAALRTVFGLQVLLTVLSIGFLILSKTAAGGVCCCFPFWMLPGAVGLVNLKLLSMSARVLSNFNRGFSYLVFLAQFGVNIAVFFSMLWLDYAPMVLSILTIVTISVLLSLITLVTLSLYCQANPITSAETLQSPVPEAEEMESSGEWDEGRDKKDSKMEDGK